MKALHVIALAAAVSIACSALTALVLSGAPSAREASAAPEITRTDVDAAIDALRRDQAAMKATLAELQSSTHRASSESSTRSAAAELTAQDVETIVARALDAARQEEAAKPATPADVAAAIQRLLAPNLTQDERIAIWDELFEKGMLDAVVAEYERRAEAAPNDSTARTELGFAYHQKMRHAASGPERGKWGQKGSEAYARALELDDTNWDARFAQAQHFWYADMPGDALRHFQILREQQRTRRPEARHSQAYVFLGNMYLEQGNAEEAKRIWAEGLLLFPGDARLRELAESVR